MFAKSYVDLQEYNIVQAALYGMLFMRLCKQSTRLKMCSIRLHVQYNIAFFYLNIRCSKRIEDKKNLIKTLIQTLHFVDKC
jgi:hypothetical protein